MITFKMFIVLCFYSSFMTGLYEAIGKYSNKHKHLSPIAALI